MVLLSAITCLSILVLVAAVVFQVRRTTLRRKRMSDLELRPNCLLTRHPIAFISGRRSVFRLFDHWNEVPLFLREHGYEVLTIEPNPRSISASALKALDELPGPCHIIADSSLNPELETIARSRHANAASLTRVFNPRRRPKADRRRGLAIDDLKPLESAIEEFEIPVKPRPAGFGERVNLALLWAHNHLIVGSRRAVDPIETAAIQSRRPFALEERFLDLAVQLAERDVRHGPGCQ